MLIYYNNKLNMLSFESNDSRIITLPHISRCAEGWLIPLTYPEGYTCLKQLQNLYPTGVKVTQDALARIKQLKEYHETEDLIPDTYVFKKSPYLHQLRSINCMLKFDKYALLLEMGLGKTFISLNYVAIRQQQNKNFFAIVICPKIVIYNWELECAKYTDLKCWVYKKGKAMPKDTNILIINYDKLIREKEILFVKSLNADCFILDEASRVKSHKSQRSKHIERLTQLTKYKYLLSGALVLGNPLDTFQPYRILSHNILGSDFWAFRNKYAVLRVEGSRRFVIGYKNLDKLKAAIDPYTLTLKRSDCIDLPERVFVKHYYDMTKEQQDWYGTIVYRQELKLTDTITIDTSLSIVKLGLLMQVLSGFVMIPKSADLAYCNSCDNMAYCIDNKVFPYSNKCILAKDTEERIIDIGKGKIKLLEEDLDLIEGKVIIWAMYRNDLNQIETLLKDKKYNYVMSSTKNSDQMFQNNNDIKVYLGQISTGIGTTLTKAETTIYYSHSLNLEHRLQSLDRNYRIGQKNNVVVIDYVCNDTIEERVLELLEKKEDVKKFIQEKEDCSQCVQSMQCFSRNIMPYTPNCIHFDKRKEAEQKLTIRITNDVDITNNNINSHTSICDNQ